jgi:hypothetical protein
MDKQAHGFRGIDTDSTHAHGLANAQHTQKTKQSIEAPSQDISTIQAKLQTQNPKLIGWPERKKGTSRQKKKKPHANQTQSYLEVREIQPGTPVQMRAKPHLHLKVSFF